MCGKCWPKSRKRLTSHKVVKQAHQPGFFCGALSPKKLPYPCEKNRRKSGKKPLTICHTNKKTSTKYQSLKKISIYKNVPLLSVCCILIRRISMHGASTHHMYRRLVVGKSDKIKKAHKIQNASKKTNYEIRPRISIHHACEKKNDFKSNVVNLLIHLVAVRSRHTNTHTHPPTS